MILGGLFQVDSIKSNNSNKIKAMIELTLNFKSHQQELDD